MPAENVISVVCSCGKRLKAPPTAAGKKARCPVCKSVVVLPSNENSIGVATMEPPETAEPPPAALGSVADHDDGTDGMYDVAEPASAAAGAPSGPACPQCHSAMDDGAVICTNCGFDTRTGKLLAVAAAPAPAKAGIFGKAAKSEGG